MKVWLILLEIIVKLIIGIATGIGLGLLTFGVTLMQHGVMLDFEALGENGPPPSELFLALGVALLSLGFTLLILFVGPFSRRRWFVLDDERAADNSASAD